MKKKILIDRFKESDYSIERKIFGNSYKLISLGGKSLENSKKLLNKIDGVLAWHENQFNKIVINNLIKCKMIVRVGIGVNNVDLNYSKKKKIIVSNVPDYGINDVADHAMTLILMHLKKINYYSDNVKNKLSWDWGNHNNLKRIQNCTLGILGCGRIGSAVALRAKSFGIKVVFFDPYQPSGYEKTLGIQRIKNMNDFLKKLDVISIHTPLTEETNNLVNDNFLKKIKKGCILINTARGQILDKNSIYKYLYSGHLSGVGLDVYPDEPPKKDDKLYRLWKDKKNFSHKIIFTPHNAFFNKHSYIELREKAAITIKEYLEQKIISNQVN